MGLTNNWELIVLVSLFTPTTYNFSYGVDLYYVWMNQLAIDMEPGVLTPYLLRTEIFLLVFSIALTTTIFVSSIVLITITNIYRKSSRNFGNLRWKWLLLAIIIAVSTIIWIGYMEIHYNICGASHWESYRPHFGVIGPAIGAGFIYVAFFLDKIFKRKV